MYADPTNTYINIYLKWFFFFFWLQIGLLTVNNVEKRCLNKYFWWPFSCAYWLWDFYCIGLVSNVCIRQKKRMSFRKGMFSLSPNSIAFIHRSKPRDVMQVSSVSVSIIIWVLAVVLFLLVLHHNFLSLSSLLRNDVTGMGTFTDSTLLSVVPHCNW